MDLQNRAAKWNLYHNTLVLMSSDLKLRQHEPQLMQLIINKNSNLEFQILTPVLMPSNFRGNQIDKKEKTWLWPRRI